METIKWAVNHMPKTEDANLKVMALDEIAKARAFHESFPQYSVTPLTKLDKMADFLGLGEDIRSAQRRIRSGNFLYRYGRKPRTRRCVGSQQAWTEIRCTDAERIDADETEQYSC